MENIEKRPNLNTNLQLIKLFNLTMKLLSINIQLFTILYIIKNRLKR